MKYIYIIIALTITSIVASAQVGQWVWLHGSNAPSSAGNAGTQGIASTAVDPPALYEGCEWTDQNGKFWFYGGSDQNGKYHNNLWKYDPASNEWEWVSGTNTLNDPGNYGTQGVASTTNRPPSRGWAAASWIDQAGNLWMFGGDNSGECNDLWEYNIGTNVWTWMKGSNTAGNVGSYGTQGVPNSTNNPHCRREGCAAWTDNAGDLWLFGGYTTSGSFNDLWRYNISSNTWTWMKGSNTIGQTGTYGVQGVENAANTPGSRTAHCRWTDKNGNFWLFGGAEWNTTNYTNELWRFNPVTNNWAWINGANSVNTASVYGTKCIASATNQPGARFENRAAWVDSSGNLWTFGGTSSGSFSTALNDLWMYCISSNQWIWEGGDSLVDQPGSWGTIGVSSATNMPNSRAGAIGWTDKKGHLYLFGGRTESGITPYNDLWQFTIDPNCASCASVAPPVAGFQSSASILCANDCINFTNQSSNATSFQWTFTGGTPTTDTSANPQNICYLSSGNFDVTLIATNSGGSDTITMTNLIKVAASPPTPVITQNHDTLYCSFDPSYTSYQWYDDTTLIAGATTPLLVVTHNGNYNVQVANENGCKIAVGINVIIGFQNFVSDNSISFSPNPAKDEIVVSGNWKTESGKLKLNILNILGQIIYAEDITSKQEIINCKAFAAGIYLVRITGETGSCTGKFVKE